MKKVILCGTHPEQFNGYSKVVFELARHIAGCTDIKLHIFGFQNFYDKPDHKLERKLPENVDVYDVYANENPKNKGFGEKLICDYITSIKPHVVIIYNDLVVINSLLNKIKEIPVIDFRIVPYVDIVYQNEKNSLIANINMICDAAIMFTPYWKQVINYQGFKKPTYVVEHGFNKDVFYPIPKKLARKFYNIKEEDFVLINLNRNQPRKRWDICIMAFVKFIANHMDDPIKLMIATNMNGGWDLTEVIISECRKYGVEVVDFQKHIIMLQNPQQITDFEINAMYNVGDVGINTCDGEGFGLCNFEQAGVGKAQIVPNIGGFKSVFRKNENSLVIDPKWSYYCDHGRDFVGGEPEVCDVDDFVDALEFYYTNRDVMHAHGQQARKDILSKYSWDQMGQKLYDAIVKEYGFLKEKEDAIVTATMSEDSSILKPVDLSDLLDSASSPASDTPVNIISKDEDESLEIVQGSGSTKDLDNMNPDEMRELLKKMLHKN